MSQYEADYADEYVEYVSAKSRLLALILAIVVGPFGAHRFYVGKTGTAIAMVVLDLTLVGIAITGIWAFIDCLIIAFGEFTDAHGYKLVEWS